MLYTRKVLILGALFISGCSTIDKAQLSSNEPEEAVTEVQKLMKSSRDGQFDLLATEHFNKGEKYFNKAQNRLGEDDERSYILENLSKSKAHFLEAKKVSKKREAIPLRVVEARKAAYESGALKSNDLKKRLNEIDSSLRNETERFSKPLTAQEFSEFERDYLTLEIEAVQNKELHTFRRIINDAEDDDAADLAPQTYDNALNDLKAAENMIQQSSRTPENYNKSVKMADRSSKLLSDVMSKLNGVAQGSSEATVLELVYQERKLGALSEYNNNLEGSLTRSQVSLDEATDKLAVKTNEAQQSQNKVKVQAAMDDMRKDFSEDEADVYQQGNNLIIRLKKINFNSGSAMVPSQSIDLLSKVNSAIQKLDASNVIVEGHTDYTGDTNQNHKLSVKRSESVAKHLKSLGGSGYEIKSRGYGETRPIANNQTKDGRAMNRRVDIVVDTSTKL